MTSRDDPEAAPGANGMTTRFSMTMMTRYLIMTLAALLLIVVMAIALWSQSLVPIIHLPGLLLVLGGTLIATMISQSRRTVLTLLCSLPHKLAEFDDDRSTILDPILEVADCYRRGDIRAAETVVKALPASFLKTGLFLVIDRHSRDHLMRILHWHIGKKRDELERETLILRTMGAYAPAFGMLGTLLGLIRMLYGLADSQLDSLGTSMGFAMLTTVYGLVVATLIFKPLSVKLEQRSKRRLAWMYAQYEAVLMIHERHQPQLIREYLDTFLDYQTPEVPDGSNDVLLNTLET